MCIRDSSYSAYFGTATEALYRAAITGAPPAGPTAPTGS